MSRNNRRLSGCLAVVVLLSACTDPLTEPRQHQARFTISDGANGGNPHFYFLRPVAVHSPQPTGVFNPGLYPTLDICLESQIDSEGNCASTLASFQRSATNSDQGLHVPAGEEMYKLVWKTSDYTIPEGRVRLLVRLGGFVAGHADIFKDDRGEFRDEAGTSIPGGNASIPVKFRIEEGVICGNRPLCTEQGLGTDGGIVTVLDNGYRVAGAEFQPNTFDQPVNVIIERLAGECLPLATGVQQYQSCFRFHTEPTVPFAMEATVGICLTDPAGAQYYEDRQLRLWKWSEVENDAILELEPTTITYLDCAPLQVGSLFSSPVMRGLTRAGAAVISPLARLLGPASLYAMAGYEGGKLSNFSRIGWVRPLQLSAVAGDNQTAAPGSAVAINPRVRIINKYSQSGSYAGADGIRVEFTPSSDGTAAPAVNNTAGGGYASTVWTLSSTPGLNTLDVQAITELAIAPAPHQTQYIFEATGVGERRALAVHWLPPIGKDAPSGMKSVWKTTATLTFTVEGSAPVQHVSAPVSVTTSTAQGSQYHFNWNVPELNPAMAYRVGVWVDGVERGYLPIRIVGGDWYAGTSKLNFSSSRTLPLKFLLHY